MRLDTVVSALIRRTGILIAGLILAGLVPVSSVFATGEFQADYDVQYAIAPTGKTIVTQHVTLTNKLTNYYPKQYSLLLDSDKITKIIAYDDGGVITPTISVKDGKTDIALTFNVKNVGLGKTTQFSLRYEHSGVASQNGHIWEIYIPGITNDPDIGAYDVTLAVPPTFGTASYLTPPPARDFTWTKEQMIRGGIAAAYGTEQYFDVTLKYSLSNTSMTQRKLLGLALPPDTAFQKVTLNSLSPKPHTVERDEDGNWIAYYDVLPAHTTNVTADLAVTTFLTARDGFTDLLADRTAYLTPKKYWPADDAKIMELAAKYKTARSIYSYVSSALTYDYALVDAVTERLGATGALNTPDRVVCTEFTDLFIAIARAAGIPARRNVGYAYTNNPKLRPLSLASDVLHAWPEYYDDTKNIWVPVDPTWANTTGGADYFTKLDFNHLVFAINGLDSSLPYPAGFYHDPSSKAKDVNVEFAKAEPVAKPAHISYRIEFPQQVASGSKTDGSIAVTNDGGESVYTVSVDARSDIGNISVSDVIPELLPYATVRIPFTARLPQTVTASRGTITAHVNDAAISTAFTVQPLYVLYAVIGGIGIIVSLILGRIGFLLWTKSKQR